MIKFPRANIHDMTNCQGNKKTTSSITLLINSLLRKEKWGGMLSYVANYTQGLHHLSSDREGDWRVITVYLSRERTRHSAPLHHTGNTWKFLLVTVPRTDNETGSELAHNKGIEQMFSLATASRMCIQADLMINSEMKQNEALVPTFCIV